MPAYSFPNKSEPIAFECPSCGARYTIVTIEAPAEARHNKIGCLKCDALFPAGEGRISLKYFLVKPKADARLTEHETVIVKLVLSGLSNKQIAHKLDISEGTVKAHLHNIYIKLGIASRRQLIEFEI